MISPLPPILFEPSATATALRCGSPSCRLTWTWTTRASSPLRTKIPFLPVKSESNAPLTFSKTFAQKFWEPRRRRRDFVAPCVVGLLVSGGFSARDAIATSVSSAAAVVPALFEDSPFPISLMLWTVYPDLIFEQRLEKVAEAGIHAVELGDEFKKWSPQDCAAPGRKKEELKITCDATAGVWHTLADPADREPFLKAVTDFVPVLDGLECSKLILQTGNVVQGLSREQMHSNCVETLKHAGDLAAKHNFELLVENIDPEENPKYFLTSAAEGFDIVRTVDNPHVKFLYDFFHEQIAGGNLFVEKVIQELNMRIINGSNYVKTLRRRRKKVFWIFLGVDIFDQEFEIVFSCKVTGVFQRLHAV